MQAMSEQLNNSDAAAALGFSRESHRSVKRLYALYEVNGPERSHKLLSAPLESKPSPSATKRVSRQPAALTRAFIISDIHVPYQDDAAVDCAFAAIEDQQPDTIIINGDMVDFFSISKWERDPRRKLMLSDELVAARALLRRLRSIAPDAEIIYVQGNHEMRLELYIQKAAPELAYLNELTIEELLRLDELGIRYERGRRNTKTAYVNYGGVLVGHFDAVAQQAGYTATRLMNKYRQPIVQAHVHRLALVPFTNPLDNSVMWGAECGCLADLGAEYVDAPNWQQGFVVATLYGGETKATLQLVPIQSGTALFNDVLYAA